MRKGIHSLYQLVKTTGKMDALNGNGYVFVGRTRKSLKVLRWHKEGLVLYNKKLELGCYTLPQQVRDASFFEVESVIFDQIVNSIKHKSNTPDKQFKKSLFSNLF